MNKNRTRTKFNKFLLFWYVVLMLVLPMVSLIASFYVYKGLWEDDSFEGGAKFFLFFFVNMPIYIIYTRLVIKEYFPVSNKNAIFLFIPLIVSYTAFFIDMGFEGFWTYAIINSLPLYLGLNLIFFLGLLFIILFNAFGSSVKELVGRLIAMLIILFLVFFAPAYFLIFGIEIHSDGLTGYAETRSLVKYFFTIVLMAVLHFGIVRRLFDKGAL